MSLYIHTHLANITSRTPTIYIYSNMKNPINLHFFLLLNLTLLLTLATNVCSDVASDRAECTDELIGIATCLPYVGGETKAPAPDCCMGFKQVTAKSVKCLCVLIRDRNDPSLGLKIEVNLALNLPSYCHTPTNISTCPKLLKLPPDSKAAREFKQFEYELERKSSITANNSSTTEAGARNDLSAGNKLEYFSKEVHLTVLLCYLLVAFSFIFRI